MHTPGQGFVELAPDLTAEIFNHELKGLLAIHLGALGAKGSPMPANPAQLGRSFRSFIGPGADWYPDQKSLAAFRATPSFAVLQPPIRGITHDPEAHTRQGQRVVAAAGLISQWSLEHPDLSVQHALGPTAPGLQARILGALATWSAEILLDEMPDENGHTADAALNALNRHGLIIVNRIPAEQPEYRLEQRRPPTQPGIATVIYEFIEDSLAARRLAFTADECVADITARLRAAGDTRDDAVLRSRILAHLREREWALELRPPTEKPMDTITARLAPSHASAITSLLEVVQAAERGSLKTIRRGQKAAQDIAADSDAREILLNKAHRFSPFKEDAPIAIRDVTIAALLRVSGPADARTVHAHLPDGVTFSLGLVQSMLSTLAEEGRVAITTRRIKDRGPGRYFYELIVDQATDD